MVNLDLAVDNAANPSVISLTPHAALLVLPSGIVWTVMNLQGQQNAACESRPGYL